MTSFQLIVNPLSGGGIAPRLAVPLARLLRDAGADVAVSYSRGIQGSCDVARDAVLGGRTVVAVGGDGMACSVAGTVLEHGGVLGLAPAGRGNDFARELAIPSDPITLAALLLRGTVRPVDVIEVSDSAGARRIVLGSVYAGVDSVASEVVDRVRRLPGRLQYPYAALRAMLAASPGAYDLTVDGVRHRHEAWTAVVANSRCYGSGMRIAPGAAVDNGLLDVVVLGAGSRGRLVRSFRRVYDGSHVDLAEVTVLRGREVTLEAVGVTAYGDGEPLAALPVTATVRPAALRVIA